jgi:hypothetical protein
LLRYDDLDGDLRLLQDARFVTTYAPHETFEERAFYSFALGDSTDRLDGLAHIELDEFAKANGIPLKRILVSLDFGQF